MINRLIAKIQQTGTPIVVGLDPMMKFIPPQIQEAAFALHGETLEGAAEAIWQYNKGIVDAVCDLIPAVKPQIAMYEQFGVPGVMAFKKTVDYCREKGLVVIGDVKRGDIGSTSEAYAVGHLGRVQVGQSSCCGFNEDFVTVNPYLGSDGVQPFIKVCREEKKGIFVLVKTSNPSSGELQDKLVDGRPVYELVGAGGGLGRGMHGRRLQLCGRGGGSHLSGAGQNPAADHAQGVYSGARLRGPGRQGHGSGAFLQQGRPGGHHQFLQRHHSRLPTGEVRRLWRGELCGCLPGGGAGYAGGYCPGTGVGCRGMLKGQFLCKLTDWKYVILNAQGTENRSAIGRSVQDAER